MSYPSVYAWQDELSAADFQAALDAAKQDAERVTKEFVESLGPSSPAYDAEWTTRYGSEDRLIFVFSVVLDLDGDDLLIYVTTPAKRRTPPPRTCADGLSAPRSMTGVSTWSPLPGAPDRRQVIDPDGLLRHAEQIAETGRGRPMDAALRRGISTAYYSIFP